MRPGFLGIPKTKEMNPMMIQLTNVRAYHLSEWKSLKNAIKILRFTLRDRFFSLFYAESVTKSPKGGASFLFLSVSLLEICTTELVKTYVNIGELGSPARKEYFV